MKQITTFIKLMPLNKKDDDRNSDILDNISMKDIVQKPEQVFKKYFKGDDTEYNEFLKKNQLAINYENTSRDQLLNGMGDYLKRFLDSVKQSGNFEVILSHIAGRDIPPSMLQETSYDLSPLSKEEYEAFKKEYDYDSSSLLSFIKFDDLNQIVKTYTIDKNIIEAKDVFVDTKDADNYIQLGIEQRSKKNLEPRYGLGGYKSTSMRINTINFTETRNIVKTLSSIGVNDVVVSNLDWNGNVSHTLNLPSQFLKEEELSDELIEFERSINDGSVVPKKDTSTTKEPQKEKAKTIKNIDKVEKPQGGSLNKGKGHEKVVEDDPKKVAIEDKPKEEEISKVVEAINYDEFKKQLEAIELENNNALTSHVEAQIKTLEETLELVPKATIEALEMIAKGANITSAMQSLKQMYRKNPSLPLLVEENLRIKYLSIKAKDELFDSMQSKIDELSEQLTKTQSEIEDKNSKIADVKKDLESTTISKNKEIDSLIGNIDQLEVSITELANMNDMQKNLLDEQDVLLKTKDEEIAKLVDIESELTSKMAVLDQKVDSLEDVINSKERNIKTLNEQENMLNKQLATKESFIVDLEKQLNAKNESIATYEKQISLKNEIIEAKEEEIINLKNKLKEQEKQLSAKETKPRD